MAKLIIAAIRQQGQLRTVTRTIALEIAHRMSHSGKGRIAYSFLADKAACSLRTAIRHVKKLVAMGLFRKRHTHTAAGYGWNEYEYTGPRLAQPPSVATARYATLAEKVPPPAREEEKSRSLGEQIAKTRGLLQTFTAGSQLWRWTMEDLTALEALRRTT